MQGQATDHAHSATACLVHEMPLIDAHARSRPGRPSRAPPEESSTGAAARRTVGPAGWSSTRFGASSISGRMNTMEGERKTAQQRPPIHLTHRWHGASISDRVSPVDVPAAFARFPAAMVPSRRRRAPGTHAGFAQGGHFAAMEHPGALADDIRRFFSTVSRAG